MVQDTLAAAAVVADKLGKNSVLGQTESGDLSNPGDGELVPVGARSPFASSLTIAAGSGGGGERARMQASSFSLAASAAADRSRRGSFVGNLPAVRSGRAGAGPVPGTFKAGGEDGDEPEQKKLVSALRELATLEMKELPAFGVEKEKPVARRLSAIELVSARAAPGGAGGAATDGRTDVAASVTSGASAATATKRRPSQRKTSTAAQSTGAMPMIPKPARRSSLTPQMEMARARAGAGGAAGRGGARVGHLGESNLASAAHRQRRGRNSVMDKYFERMGMPSSVVMENADAAVNDPVARMLNLKARSSAASTTST